MDNHLLHKELESKYRGIVAVGTGYKTVGGERTDTVSTVVYVQKKLPLDQLAENQLLPSALGGLPTDVVELGKVVAYENTDMYRPAIGGVSVGHRDITAGTVACKVYDKFTGVSLLLSNNHVLAMSNDAQIGDPIYQPGPADGGLSTEPFADLVGFVPIKFVDVPTDPDCDVAGLYVKLGNVLAQLLRSKHRVRAYQEVPLEPNYVDAAVARPFVDQDLSPYIKDVGFVLGITEPEIGLSVKKSGRTTELTVAEIQSIDASVSVGYGGSKTAYFVNQIIVVGATFSAPGDSGSLVLDMSNNAVGLLFAGGQGATIVNPIRAVEDLLDISIVE